LEGKAMRRGSEMHTLEEATAGELLSEIVRVADGDHSKRGGGSDMHVAGALQNWSPTVRDTGGMLLASASSASVKPRSSARAVCNHPC
jgi:hypothetical protein